MTGQSISKRSAPFTHGGDLSRLAAEIGSQREALLDFSASINPLGMPPAAREAIIAGLEGVAHYPDPLAEELVAAIAQAYRLDARRLLAGNGSTELLYLALRVLRPRRVLLTAPGFSEYQRAATLAGAKIKYLTLRAKTGFQIEPHRFIAAMEGCDLALLRNPNNPTGHALDYHQMTKIAAAAAARALLSAGG
ncbi:MAG: aminotransferase class I/II-fold pyridoxal phosphate-dependent enzyme [Desulfurivibrio sp.]|nr:aminotransferase class I/II-fold pyridoxal phosphate-dependent enzyme [Desulfurivibrio sp.]